MHFKVFNVSKCVSGLCLLASFKFAVLRIEISKVIWKCFSPALINVRVYGLLVRTHGTKNIHVWSLLFHSRIFLSLVSGIKVFVFFKGLSLCNVIL